MKLTHISPEFNYTNVNGTLSMREKKSFLCSKLLKFDDSISIASQNIIYYQSSQNEQLNLSTEQLLSPILYNTDNDKQNNSTLSLDQSQNNNQINNNTAWILNINYGTILTNYLFATLKKYRTFEGVANNITINNDVNSAIGDYIKNNLLGIYQLDSIQLYLSYNDLTNGVLRYNNIFDQKIETDSNLLKRFLTKNDTTNLLSTIKFNQEQISLEYSFNYYFNLYFSKI